MFTATAAIHPLRVKSCTAQSSAEDSPCSLMYDGLSTHWAPNVAKWQGGPQWVEFHFSDKEVVNRMWFRHDLPSSSSALLLAQERRRPRGGVRFLQVTKAASAQKFTVEFDDGSKHDQLVRFTGESKDAMGFAGSPTTLLLPKATTKYVRLTLANPDQLVMSEVLFWHSEIETQAGLTSGDAPAHTKWGGTDSESVRDQKTTSTSGDGDGDGDGDGHGGTSGDGDGELLLSRHVGITQMRKKTNGKRHSMRSLDSAGSQLVTSGALVSATRGTEMWAGGPWQGDLTQAGYCGPVCKAIEIAETIAMNICLLALTLIIAILSAIEAAIAGIAAVLILALEAAMKAMGPHFFQIVELYIAGSFSALGSGKTAMTFRLNMWLFDIHIKFGFSIVFSFVGLIGALFKKAASGLTSLFRL